MSISLSQDKFWTYSDYQQLPDDGQRYEIMDGVLYMSPSPNHLHQLLSKRLEFFFYQFELEGQGFIYNAPFDLHLPECTPVQPDLIFLTNQQRDLIQSTGIFGPPHLVVEILSPGTRSIDRVKKLSKYLKAGIPNYMIVDPEATIFEHLQLQQNHYTLACSLSQGDTWEFNGRSLDLDAFFRDLL